MRNLSSFTDWVKKIPKVSFLLLIATYGVFGWLYSSWMMRFALQLQLRWERIAPITAHSIAYAIGLLAVLTIVLFFTAPMSLFTLGMDSWFRIDAKAFVAIAISIMMFAIVIEHPVALARFLILSAAAILFRLDLRTMGCPKIRARIILLTFSSIAFTVGVRLFYIYGITV